MKLQFNETTYEFKPYYVDHNELHIFKDGKLVHKQFMHVDLFKTGYLSLKECVNLINNNNLENE